MTQISPKIRLFIEDPLHEGQTLVFERAQAHYLFNVMRLKPGESVALFDGQNGEWRAEIVEARRKAGTAILREKLRAQETLPDLHLLFAPIKKARTDFIVEKACELGCAAIRPVITRYTNSDRLNPERLRAHMIEAAEQCGGLSVPELLPATKLDAVLAEWDETRALIFCDEARTAKPISDALAGMPRGHGAAVLIGPEGGFAPEESVRIRALDAAIPVTLGPRILRADTAAVAAIALVQAQIGDWDRTE